MNSAAPDTMIAHKRESTTEVRPSPATRGGRARALAVNETLVAAIRAGGRFRSHEIQALIGAEADAWYEHGLGIEPPEIMLGQYGVKRQALRIADAKRSALFTYKDPALIGRQATPAEVAACDAASDVYFSALGELMAHPAANEIERADQIAIAEALDVSAVDLLSTAPLARPQAVWPDRYDTAEKWREIAPHFTDAQCQSMAAKTAARIAADEPRYAELVLKFKELGLDAIADHAAQASAHGLMFDGYIQDALQALNPDRVDPRTQWGQALAAFESASQAREQASEKVDSIYAAADQVAPYPPELLDKDGAQQSLSDITDDKDRPFAERVAMAEKLAAWNANFTAFIDQSNLEEAEDQHDAAYDARQRALIDLIDAPAPTPSAAAYKLRMWLDRVYCGKVGYDIDDPQTVAELLAEPNMAGPWAAVRVYQDLLRLSGERPELHDPVPFDPTEWIEGFEGRHLGSHVTDFGPYWWGEKEPPPAALKSTAGAEWRALHPWQKEHVREAAKHRATEIKSAADAGPEELERFVRTAGGTFTLIDGDLYLGRAIDAGALEFYLRDVEYHLCLFGADKAALKALLEARAAPEEVAVSQ